MRLWKATASEKDAFGNIKYEGRLAQTLEGHTGRVYDVAVQGNKLASTDTDKLIRLWRL